MLKSYYTHKGHLSKHERATIEHLTKERKSIRFIARRLDRSPSTISREMGRNRGLRGYRYSQAHQKSRLRQQEHPRYRVLTDTMKAQVHALLKEHWSPEQIVGFGSMRENPRYPLSHSMIGYTRITRRVESFIAYFVIKAAVMVMVTDGKPIPSVFPSVSV